MEEKKNIYQKLAAAKKDIGAIEKNSENPFFKKNYFDISALLAVVEPPLLKNGLIVLQPIIDGVLRSQLVDIDSKEMIESFMPLSDIADPQKKGSEITYFRRYTLQSLLSLQAEDDDANAATKAKKKAPAPTETFKTQKPPAKKEPIKEPFKKKEELTPDSPRWNGAIDSIIAKETTIELIKTQMILSKDNETLLARETTK